MPLMVSPLRRFPPPSLPPGERVYAIGDVHGRLDLLAVLVEQIAADDAARGAATTHVLLLGDLIDRGRDSAAVVRRIMAGDRRFASFGALKGNHEASLLSVLEGDTRWLESWLTYGGRATLVSWGVAGAVIDNGEPAEIAAAAACAVPPAEWRWLAGLPSSQRHGDYFFAHAGIRPGIPIAVQTDADLLWIRHEFLADARDHGACIVHGHTISPEPESRGNRIGIDTGAYRTGTLTAVGLEADRRWFLATGAERAAA